MAPLTRQEVKRFLPLILVLTLCMVHAACCLRLFHPVRGILGPDPLLVGDYPWHLYGVETGWGHLHHAGRAWGYDPGYMAGAANPPMGPQSNFPLRMLYPLVHSWVSPAIFLKLFALASAVFSLPLFLFGVRLIGGRGWSLVVCASLGILIWWLGLPFRMMKWGMFLFVLVSYGSLPLSGLLYLALKPARPVWCMLAGLVISFFVFLHPGALLALMPSFLILGLYHWKTSWKGLVGIGIGFLPVVFLLSGFFLQPLIYFLKHGYAVSLNMSTPMLQTTSLWGPLEDLFRYKSAAIQSHQPGRIVLDLTIILLALGWGFHRFRSGPWTSKEMALGGSCVFLLLLTYYGSFLPGLGSASPYRFKVDFLLYAAPLASDTFLRSVRRAKIRDPLQGAIVLATLAGGFVAIRGALPAMVEWRPLSTILHPQATEIFDWMGQRTDPTARILLEDSGPLDRDHPGIIQYFDGHFPALLSSTVGREFIGGPYPYLGGMFPGPCDLLKSGHASFVDGYLCRKDLSQISRECFEEILDLYNIRWIVCWSRRSLAFFPLHSDRVVPSGRISGLQFYDVLREGDFFLKGHGRCKAELDRIRLTEVEPEEGEIILSYHWYDILETVPACIMDGCANLAPLSGDPLPFIRIKNPPPELEIRVKGYRVRRDEN